MNDTLVIKIGGSTLEQLTDKFFEQLRQIQHQGTQIVIVHGSGPMINQACTDEGLSVVKKNGLRVTDAMTLAVMTKLVLTEVQPNFVTALQAHGLNAIGASCQLPTISGDFLDEATYGYVGVPMTIPAEFMTAFQQHHIMVVGPVCQSVTGQWLNVNADDMAAFLASELHASRLALMTDVPGLLYYGHVMPNIHHAQMQRLVAGSVIKSGMVPKLNAAYTALEKGVAQVEILGDLTVHGTLVLP